VRFYGVARDITDYNLAKQHELEAAQEIAAIAERHRLARDLHDNVSQLLFSATITAQSLPQLLDSEPALARQTLTDLHRLTRGAQAEMRSLLLELSHDGLSQADLYMLLHLLADAFVARTGRPIDMDIQDNFDVDNEVKEAIYRIAQESLTNVAKHARASRVAMRLHHEEHQIELLLTDNGIGFDPDDVSADRLGVRVMHERAANLGLLLEITSQPGAGTVVRACWQKEQSNAAS
jgi:signal transduction histidine kinase